MKYILYRFLLFILIYILLSSKGVKGKKATINLFSNNLINSIKIEPYKSEIVFSNPHTGKRKLYLDCEPGDKIIINITLKNKVIKIKNDFFMYIEFYDMTKFFFNNNNISINNTNQKNNINIFFYIPYETYCKDNNNIVVDYTNKSINIDLKSNIFVKNNKIQSLERLEIKIIETFPSNLMFYNNNLNNIFTIFPSDYLTPILIKYNGISNTGGSQPLNECSIKILYNNYNYYNNFNSSDLRILDDNDEDFIYYNVSLFNTSKALENNETIKRFFKEGYNVFNISDDIFNDLCIYVEEDGKDVVLNDRIELYFQNYTICNEGCVYSEIDMENFIVTCKCSESIELNNDNIGRVKEIKDDVFSKESISEEISDIFFETNFEVLSCFSNLFSLELYLQNIGAILTTVFIIVQIIAGALLIKQIKDIRIYLYKDIIKNSNPPFKKGNSISEGENEMQIESVSRNKNMKLNINNSPNNKYPENTSIIKLKLPKNKRKKKKDNIGVSSSKKALIVKKNTKFFDDMYDEKMVNNFLNNKLLKSSKINRPIKKIYPLPKNSINYSNLKEIEFPFFESEISSQRKFGSKYICDNLYSPKVNNIPRIYRNSVIHLKKFKNSKFDDENKEYLYSQKTLPHNKKEENKRYQIKNKSKERDESEEEEEKQLDNKFLYRSNINIKKISLDNKIYGDNAMLSDNFVEKTDRDRKKDLEKDKPKIKIRKCKTKKSENRRRRSIEGQLKKKNTVQMYEKKELDEDELNELDFDEAVVFDHRSFCELFWMEIKQRQLIVNTFFVKEKLKPFSIKLIVFIFSLSCYFVINGFLYDTNYVSKRLKRKSKTFYFFIVDSIKRIIYSSIVIAIINLLVGLLFKSDKTLRKAQVKYKDNKILLNGEVVKIFKNMKIFNFLFTIIDFIFMVVIWIYLFCFCGVYRNCQMDWIGSTGIIIGVMQLLPIVISLLLAFLRIIGLRCGIEICFKINSWISDNT